MRQRDSVLLLKDLVGRKVGNVSRNLAAFESLCHCLGIDQLAACEVDDADAVLHLLDCFCADGVLRVSVQRNVNGDVVAVREDLIQVGNVLDRAVELECAVNRQERVVAPDLHVQTDSRVCDLDADRAQTDDAELLARDLRTCIGRLALLSRRADIRRALEALYPVCALYDLARREQQRTDDQLLDRICVRTRGVEYDDALLRAAVDRNVVDACACAGDALEVCRELHIVQLCGADENRVVVLEILRAGVLFGIKVVQTDLGNLVVELYVIHDCLLIDESGELRVQSGVSGRIFLAEKPRIGNSSLSTLLSSLYVTRFLRQTSS